MQENNDSCLPSPGKEHSSPQRTHCILPGFIENMDSAILAKAKVTLPHHAQLTTCKRENNSICFVISGVLTLEALLHDGRRQVLGFRYPGDLAPSALRHVLPASNIVAAIDAELIDLSKLSRDAACAA